MKARKIGYWVTTALVALAFLAGGLFDLGQSKQVVDTLARLGYPAYLAVVLGAWKVLGALAIAAPRLPRVKEWAYAGIVFDLTGAAVSHAVVGDGADTLVAPVVLLSLTCVSWALRPASRRLSAAGAEEGAPSPRDLEWARAQAA